MSDRAWDGTTGRKYATDEVLTMDKLLDAVRLLGPGPGMLRRPAASHPVLAPRYRVITSDALTVSEPRILSRWDRFRVWVEGLADQAEVYYHYPRVQRTFTKPSPDVLIIGHDTIVCHPSIYAQIRQRYGVQS